MSGLLTLPSAFRITDVREENYRTRTFVLDGRLDASPGQFVMAWLPRFDEKPFSLVSADPLTIMVNAVGPFSRLMHERRPGDRVWLRGPFGRGFTVDESFRRIVLVGGGYGVAPLYWLARNQGGITPHIDCIVGARSADDLLFARSFTALHAASTDYLLTLTTEDGSVGLPGRVTDALSPMLASGDVDGVYACGPHTMLAALDDLCHHHGVPSQLSWEAYMRCGIGICGACEQDGKVLCLDGPVLQGHH